MISILCLFEEEKEDRRKDEIRRQVEGPYYKNR